MTTYFYGNGLVSENCGSITLYHHYNHLGSTTKLTDADGYVVETYTYGTYGELLSGDAKRTRFLYNGKQGVSTDDNGLFYMRKRYYNPEIKRFINQDILAGSLDNSQSLNRYCYVQGNPVSYVDPFGLSPMNPQEIRHAVLGLLGCIPGPVGAIANGYDAYLYFSEGDMGMAALSLLGALSGGLSSCAKAASAIGRGTGLAKFANMGRTAQKMSLACDLAGSGYSFLKNGSMTIESGADIVRKLGNGETVTGVEWLNFSMNVAGTALSAFTGYNSAKGLKNLKQAQITGRMKESVEGVGSKTSYGKSSGNLTSLVKYDPDFAASQILDMPTNITPGGRIITVHAADRMVNPPNGRGITSIAEIDSFLDGVTKVRKITQHTHGDTLTLRNINSPRVKEVVVDSLTGRKIITVITKK